MGIHVKCTFLGGNQAATCLAVVHKKLLHLVSDGLRTIIASRTFKRSHNSNIVSGFIKNLKLEDYQVGVVEVRQTVEPDGNVALCVVQNLICSLYYRVNSEKKKKICVI